mgnify:CR=1 FL=1
MQIGIDVGATKIESVILEDNGEESHRSRVDCPRDYLKIIYTIKDIVNKLEKEFNKELPLGVCHPGTHSPQTGLVKNAPNCNWLEKKPFQSDLRKSLNKEVFCENDANCFALSEAIDGSGKHYKIVYGIILGSGAGGGLVIDKKIVSGPNGVAGEWGHNQLPYLAAKKEKFDSLLKGYQQHVKISNDEKNHFNTLLRGAAMRILVTRLHDQLYHPDGAMVVPKDPFESFNILKWHQNNSVFDS